MSINSQSHWKTFSSNIWSALNVIVQITIMYRPKCSLTHLNPFVLLSICHYTHTHIHTTPNSHNETQHNNHIRTYKYTHIQIEKHCLSRTKFAVVFGCVRSFGCVPIVFSIFSFSLAHSHVILSIGIRFLSFVTLNQIAEFAWVLRLMHLLPLVVLFFSLSQ